MKKILTIVLIAATLVSCNNDLETEGLSRITFYPEFVLEGERIYVIDEDDPFIDPGVTVLEQGTEIPFNFIYTGRYTGYSGSTIGTEIDEYSLSYSAVNKDGFTGYTSRTIFRIGTGDFVNSIEGAYLGTSERVTGETFEDVMVLVTQEAPGVFEVSCALAGFYADGRALGDDYLVHGLTITLNDLPNNDFTFESDVTRGDGVGLQVSDLTIDPESKTISFTITTTEFADGEWEITLEQVQP